MSETELRERPAREASDSLLRALRDAGEPLPVPEQAEEFGAMFDRFGDARVVLLGEATHGASEFYRARAAITRRLIERHGFTIVAVEADWPDAARINKRLSYLGSDGEAWFDAYQNARIVRAAERYYRAMYRGANESWNLRDRHMFETLQSLVAYRGVGSKAIVWAHNAHVGNAAATAMGWHGQFNIGELCRLAYGDEVILIGFGTDAGTVAAASDWGADMEIKTVRPARADSYEHAFRRTGLVRSLTDWRSGHRLELAHTLREPLLERAIGVVYRPESELLSHYFEAVLAEQFDAFIWFEQTKAVTPLGHEKPHGAPETYPFGL